MNLTQRHEWPELAVINGAEFAQKNLAIAADRGLRIFSGESQIQRLATVNTGEAASPRRKCADEPGELAKICRADDLNAGSSGLNLGHIFILAESYERPPMRQQSITPRRLNVAERLPWRDSA